MLVTDYSNETEQQVFKKDETFFEQAQESSKKSDYGWSDEQINYLKENYLTKSYPQIAKEIGKKANTVSVKASRLGLVKPDTNNKGQFRKNHSLTPSVQDNTIRRVKKCDGYIMRIKVSGEWKALHRHVWEQENGAIPEGMNIYFKDNNPENCKIENLEMLTPPQGLVQRQPSSEARSETAKSWWSEKKFNEELSNIIESVEAPAAIVEAPEPIVEEVTPLHFVSSGDTFLASLRNAAILDNVNNALSHAVRGADTFYEDMKAKGLVPVRSEDGKTTRWMKPEKAASYTENQKTIIVDAEEEVADFKFSDEDDEDFFDNY